MTENFSGFSDEMCRFFIELRFNNNKEWFGANRDRYTKLVKEPMDAFAAELNEALIKQTGVKTMFSVSRINRDIRFTKNKEPYRDHRWVVFKRDVGDWKRKPVLYFEIGAEYYSVGLGFYDALAQFQLTGKPIRTALAAKVTHTDHFFHGVTLLMSLGNIAASRTFLKPRRCIVSRSSPKPNPPCGGAPYLWSMR